MVFEADPDTLMMFEEILQYAGYTVIPHPSPHVTTREIIDEAPTTAADSKSSTLSRPSRSEQP